jgi:uncharacterized protein YbjT (DUF2867 family)
LPESNIVAVDGATGYLGNHLIARLREDGCPVRAIAHSAARSSDLEFLRSSGAEVHSADLKSGNPDLQSALQGVSTVVHLIGSIAPKKGEKLIDLHAGQTAALIEAAKSAGVPKIVLVTALGTRDGAVSNYHKTKSAAEQVVTASGMQYVILRPSLIVGRQVGNRDSKLVARYIELIKTRPSVPLIGGGLNKVQPVFIGDLVEALVRSIQTNNYNGRVLEIGGTETVSIKSIVERLMRVIGISKRTVALPPILANVIGSICEAIQPVPLVSRDQVTMSSEDNLCTNNALTTVFGITPTSLEDALKTYNPTNSAAYKDAHTQAGRF